MVAVKCAKVRCCLHRWGAKKGVCLPLESRGKGCVTCRWERVVPANEAAGRRCRLLIIANGAAYAVVCHPTGCRDAAQPTVMRLKSEGEGGRVSAARRGTTLAVTSAYASVVIDQGARCQAVDAKACATIWIVQCAHSVRTAHSSRLTNLSSQRKSSVSRYICYLNDVVLFLRQFSSSIVVPQPSGVMKNVWDDAATHKSIIRAFSMNGGRDAGKRLRSVPEVRPVSSGKEQAQVCPAPFAWKAISRQRRASP